MATNKIVKVSVKGGVLSVDEMPEGVEVELTEYDNREVTAFLYDRKRKRVVEFLMHRLP